MRKGAAPIALVDQSTEFAAPAPRFEERPFDENETGDDLDPSPPQSDRFELLDDVQLGDLTPPEWIIESIVPSNSLVVLIAPPKSLKSFLVLDWAMHIAIAMDWHGYQVKRGEVIYVYAEGASGLQQRVKAWKFYNQIQGRYGVLFLPRRVLLNEGPDANALVDAILSRSPEPRLIIIDTLARNMAGDENSTEAMSAFVRGCDYVREETGATVVVVHHTGHAAEGRARGSSVLPAAADTLIQLTRDGERIQLECKFQKDAPEFPVLALEACPVRQSLVLKPIGINAGALTGNRLLVLEALHTNFGDEGARHKGWKESIEIANGSFGIALRWLRDNAYVRSGSGGKYTVTETGRLALSPHSTRSPASVQSVQSIRGGLYRDHPMDHDHVDRGEAWEPEELDLSPPDSAEEMVP